MAPTEPPLWSRRPRSSTPTSPQSAAEELRCRQDEFDWMFPDGRSYPEAYDPNITATVSGTDNRMMTQSAAAEQRLHRPE